MLVCEPPFPRIATCSLPDGQRSELKEASWTRGRYACTECRKKRAKCDGKVPCGRCSTTSVECVYEVPVRQSKEHMRLEIEQLRAQQRNNERLLAALVSDRSDQILDQLRNLNGEPLESITEKLDESDSQSAVSGGNVTKFTRSADEQPVRSAVQGVRSIVSSPASIMGLSDTHRSSISTQHEGNAWPTWGSDMHEFQEPPSASQQDEMMNWVPDTVPIPNHGLTNIGLSNQSVGRLIPNHTINYSRGEGQGKILGEPFGMEEHPERPHPNYNQSWTNVTPDGAFVEHLMALYFCWEYPTFASLSKEHFLEDFRTGNRRHCSSLLVNSVLAVGCRFSNQASARADPNNPDTAGDHFFAEADRQLHAEPDRHTLTTIQAMGLMSIRQASCGRSSHSLFLSGQSIRLAVEMGLHLDEEVFNKNSELEHEVRSATFWGAFSLDQAWSLTIGRLPYFSRDTRLVTKPPIVEHREASVWVPYTDDGAPLEPSCIQPSNVRSVYKTFCELAEIVHRSMYTLYTPGANVTSKTLLETYTEYLGWYDAIPTTLRLGHNFTPAVLFAHMYYHYAILLLFRPFVKLEIIGSGVSPVDLCAQAADALSTLINSYSKLYTLRRTPSFVPYFVLTSSITHLVNLGNERSGPEQFRQGVADMREMTGWHGFAKISLDILQYLADRWGIHQAYERDGRRNDAKTLSPSKTTSLNLFCPNVATIELEKAIGLAKEGENPLFWAFPMHGRPLMDTGGLLEKGGFRLLG